MGKSERRFGRWLQRELDQREWSQADFARRSGLSTGVVSQWINDRRVPTPKSLDRIAGALLIDMPEVYRHAGLHAPAEDAPEVQAVLGALRRVRLTPERVHTLRAVLESWASYDRTSPAKDAASES